MRAEEKLHPVDRLLRGLRVGLLLPLVDIAFIAALTIMGGVFLWYVRHGVVSYNLVVEWWMVVAVIEAAALWQALSASPFLASLGVRALNLQPKAHDGATPNWTQCLRYWVLWHLFPFSWLGAVGHPQGLTFHERGAGLELQERKIRWPAWWITLHGWAVLALIMFTLGAAWGTVRVDVVALLTRAGRTVRFWRAIFNPSFPLLGRGLQLLAETFFMAFMATLCAVPVAAVLSFFAARNLMRGFVGRLIYTILRMVGSFTRSVDAVIWAIIFAVWVGVGSFAGVLALWLHSIVDLMKLYSEQLESIDPGPVEAITATGANRAQVIRYGIIPQIINPYLSFTLYRWDINVRMATVVGLVGGGGIGFRLAEYLKNWAFAEATMLTILIIVLVWAIDYVSARLRAKLA